MRSVQEGMENDPTSSRNYDRDPADDMSNDGVSEMEEYAAEFLAEDNFDENSDFHNQEFSALNNQLDQLQSALDMLESRNADIHQELLQLLQSNREVRRVIVEEMEETTNDNSSSSTTTLEPEDLTTTSNNTTTITTIPDSSSSAATIVLEATTQIEKVIPVLEATSSIIQSIDAIKLEKVTN